MLGLLEAVTGKAEQYKTAIMPGYTHLQRAQPITFGHHLMAYAMMLQRDIGRLDDTAKRMDVSPIGCCALAGTTFPIDRVYEAQQLGFSQVALNSLDGVSDRDFCVEFLSACAVLMMHLSRLSEELGVERQNMKVQLQDLVARQGNRREKREFNRIVQENMRKTARETMATDASLRKLRAEDRLISLLLRYPDCSRLCKDFDPQWLTPGFAQRVFMLILQRLENGDGTELMDLRDRLTDDEMGRLSGIPTVCKPFVLSSKKSRRARQNWTTRPFVTCFAIIHKPWVYI